MSISYTLNINSENDMQFSYRIFLLYIQSVKNVDALALVDVAQLVGALPCAHKGLDFDCQFGHISRFGVYTQRLRL